MPIYDFECQSCGAVFDKFVKHGELPACACGGATAKVWASNCPSFIPDDVPGGFVIHNLDTKPRKFYSKSAYRDELRARGLQIRDRHMGDPEGGDKARLQRDPNTGRMTRATSRWV